nr:hypothetical protein GCM10020093_041910 [Planobispora longispora]
MDNCEHVVGAAAELTDRVLAGCPGVRILATSREPLGITGELTWPVPPLELPRRAGTRARRSATRPPACSPSAPRPYAPVTGPSRRLRRWCGSAASSTACPWPSNWPPPGSGP